MLDIPDELLNYVPGEVCLVVETAVQTGVVSALHERIWQSLNGTIAGLLKERRRAKQRDPFFRDLSPYALLAAFPPEERSELLRPLDADGGRLKLDSVPPFVTLPRAEG